MVLMNRAASSAGFFVLTQASNDLFVIRAWNERNDASQAIRPGEPISGTIHNVITGSMPVPGSGALLGWVIDSQVTALLAVQSMQPGAWAAGQVPVPEILVMPMEGTIEPLHWPPFTANPLGDGRLWEYVERGELVDLIPLVAQRAGRAFWIPSPGIGAARPEKGCVVVTDSLSATEYWLSVGVYLDHRTLREGIQAPPASRLLTLPGVVDLAHGLLRE